MSFREPLPSPSLSSRFAATGSTQYQPSLPNFDLRNQIIPWLDPSVRKWESVKLVLRSCLGLVSFGICGAVMSYEIHMAGDPFATAIAWPAALPAMGGALWDLADSLVRYARRGRSLPPKAQIGCELFVIASSLAGAGVFIWQMYDASQFSSNWLAAYNLVHVSFIGLLGVAALVGRTVMLVRACQDRARDRKATRPQTVYIPSMGTAAYVVLRYAPDVDEIELETLEKDAIDANAARTSSDSIIRPATPNAAIEDVRARLGVMRERKRESRPPTDYVPDEAELKRRMRGEAQPQVILPGDVFLKFAMPGTDAALEVPYSVENKTLVPPILKFGTAGASARSSAASSASLRRIQSWG